MTMLDVKVIEVSVGGEIAEVVVDKTGALKYAVEAAASATAAETAQAAAEDARDDAVATVTPFTSHIDSTDGHPVATTVADGFMSAADKVKLNGLVDLVPFYADTSEVAAATITADTISIGGVLFQVNAGGFVTDAASTKFAPVLYVTPRMFGAAGDGSTDDLVAVRASWDYAAANKIPVLMEGLEYNCSDRVWTSSNLTVIAGGAVMYITAWPSFGGFVGNFNVTDTDRIQSNIVIDGLITDGSKLSAPSSGQNTNLGPEFSQGASNVVVRNCIARNIRFGLGAGTGGAGFGGERGLHNVVFENCYAENCLRGARIAALNSTNSNGSSMSATAVVFSNFVAKHCGTGIFCHAMTESVANVSENDLSIFDAVFYSPYFEDCGHTAWEPFDFTTYPSVSPQKSGVISFSGARNVRIVGARVKLSSTYPASYTDWLSRAGYPASGNYIGAGLSGNVGSIVKGWGSNIVIDGLEIDGDADLLWDFAKNNALGEISSTSPTYNSTPSRGIEFRNVRHVRGTLANVVDSFTGTTNSLVSAKIEAKFRNEPTAIIKSTSTFTTATTIRVEIGDLQSTKLAMGSAATIYTAGNTLASFAAGRTESEALTTGDLSVGGGTVVKKILTASASLNFPSISANSYSDLTITVTGASVGNAVFLGLSSAATAGIIYQAFVSATDTVTVRAYNVTGSAIDPAAMTHRVVVFKY